MLRWSLQGCQPTTPKNIVGSGGCSCMICSILFYLYCDYFKIAEYKTKKLKPHLLV